MPRRKRCRWVFGSPTVTCFKPRGIPMRNLETVVLSLDETEALRLADGEGQYQVQAAASMKVSRATFGRILAAARSKVADALLNGKAMVFEPGKGVHRIEAVNCEACGFSWEMMPEDGEVHCPSCGQAVVNDEEKKGAD